SNFGIDPAQPKGDIESYIAGENIYFNPVTEKGEKFMAEFAGLFENSDDKAVKDSQAKTREIMSKLPFNNLPLKEFGGDKLDTMFARPEWQALSESCIGCGTCTYVCPTCQCYDVRDYKTNTGVKRFRCWDSCMRKDFTMMAHGTNRPSHMQRFRQRFMHKLVYHPANHNGEFSCVGCGRCVAKCPVSMNIVKVMKTLGGNK
ncbi:MAG TPA: 4Fe-4S dicluster domain-containing protein, partial [Clostridia bacterium]|nr:4Fe-4S dicluster domain-containing protein [Clostridia bacterium]